MGNENNEERIKFKMNLLEMSKKGEAKSPQFQTKWRSETNAKENMTVVSDKMQIQNKC